MLWRFTAAMDPGSFSKAKGAIAIPVNRISDALSRLYFLVLCTWLHQKSSKL